MTMNLGRFEYTHSLQMDNEVFNVRDMIPYKEKEQMAQDIVSGTVVFDEEAGIAYEAYNADLIRAFLILKYYTDLELAEYDNAEGRYAIYDVLASHGLWRKIMDIVELDMDDVDVIAFKLGSSARRSFEEKHSLSRMLMKTFGALLGTEDLTQTVAKAEALNGKLIDMLATVQKQPVANTGGLQLAKKES